MFSHFMFVAAVNGNADVAKLLIKNDAAIDSCDVDGKTALMIAVINGHQNLVELLLKHEADIKVKNAVSFIFRLSLLERMWSKAGDRWYISAIPPQPISAIPSTLVNSDQVTSVFLLDSNSGARIESGGNERLFSITVKHISPNDKCNLHLHKEKCL